MASLTCQLLRKKVCIFFAPHIFLQKFAHIFAVFFALHKIVPQIFAIIFAKRKKYRKYLQYFLSSAKNTVNICGIFCGAQKLPQKNRKIMGKKIWLPQIFAIFFAERKNYRKY